MTCTLCDNYIGSSDLFVAPNETCNTFHSCNTSHNKTNNNTILEDKIIIYRIKLPLSIPKP